LAVLEMSAKYIGRPWLVLPASTSFTSGLAAASFLKYSTDWS
jgi:hypothetical protein